jgi:hypothetical protein
MKNLIKIKPITDPDYSHEAVAFQFGKRLSSHGKGTTFNATLHIVASAACFQKGDYDVEEISENDLFGV